MNVIIKDQLEGLDSEQFINACLNTKKEPTNISVVSGNLIPVEKINCYNQNQPATRTHPTLMPTKKHNNQWIG